eukprot:CAMPEP_0114422426 /NCGR_PEP_ID=MMETSP0103-20121206/5603_1 /TAXON_ID=37642 ORGANISM="Paraphysomonas imperforata, Strain PA2" /NCGR_SAMPLE_ID=MMETSP0103 /ASSEMBLY_ACC=CAM_ASM_000201 /LENGTH=1340 /DNA_ID=CAMNT_0001591009 /DNA_START=89 /DNA_END=4111 /DNA_ORIENTATION=+
MKTTQTSPPTDTVVEAELQCLLNHVSPSYESDRRRRGLINYIQELFDAHCHNYKLALGGSFPLQVYLPESDLDVTMLTENDDDLNSVMQIFSCLCQAIKDNEKQNDLPFAVDNAEFKIQSIEFINARIKVVKCVINRMSLDITANQRNSLASATFLEEANRLIGHDNLYKRSIILVKVWCLQESAKYNSQNVSISGSKEGMFSSYALSILVLYLFNLYPVELTTPLQVLRSFLETFSTFHFDKFVLSLDGPVPIQNGGGSLDTQSEEKTIMENRFRSIAEKVYHTLRSKERSDATPPVAYMTDCNKFRLRTCNIVDPVDPVNNLGVSVTWKNFRFIKSTLTKGLQHLNDSLMYMESSLIKKCVSVSPPVGSGPDPTMMNAASSTASPLLSNTPPPPSQRKPVVNMDALSGAVNGIAPGLVFPSNTSPATSLPATSPTLNPTIPGPLSCPSMELDMSPTNSNALNASLSPPPSVQSSNGNGNPSTLVIAPAIMATSTITGIAATGGILRGNNNGASVGNTSAAVPVLPTNTLALAKEFRFLKRFFPNCVTCYQLENVNSSVSFSGHPDAAVNGSSNGSSNPAYISKMARSTSPFRDVSPVLNVPNNRTDRSQSISFSSQTQQHQQMHLKSIPPSRSTSDTAGTGSSNQPVSFLGAATMPVRMRSQSYTSLHPSGVEGGRFVPAERVAERPPLQGDLAAMWEALNYDIKSSKKVGNTESSSTSTSNRIPGVGNSDSLSDNSDAFTSVDDSSPPRSPSEKDNPEHFSNFGLNMDISCSSVEESKEKQMGRNIHIRSNELPPQPIIKPGATHPSMPPLIKKMPPLTVPVTKQKNSFSILESPINRKIASENNIQEMESRQNQNTSNNSRNSGSNQNNQGNSTTGKGRRKKGKGKDLLMENTDTGGKNQKNVQNNQNAVPDRSTTDRENGERNSNEMNEANNHEDNENFFLKNNISQYLMWTVVVTVTGLVIFYCCGWLSPTVKHAPEMRSAYMKAHQHHAYQGNADSSTHGSASGGVMGSGFGKKAHSSLGATNPLEERPELHDEAEEEDDDDEKNMSTLYDKFMKRDENETAYDMKSGGIIPSSHSEFLEDSDDLVNVAELWLVKGQNVTLGLSIKAQESYQKYMSGMSKRMLGAPGDDPASMTKHEGMWFKESTPLIHSNSSIYLKVTNMNVNTTGIYTFAIVKQKIRKGFSARPKSGKMMSVDSAGRVTSPPSAQAVASVNGDILYREGVSIIDAKLDPSFEVIRVLSRTVLRLGAAPSSPTREMHMVLTSGSQLYLHIDYEGSPQPSLQWYKNGMPLKKERKDTLIVNDVSKSHEGTYTCVLLNMAGKYVWLEATVIINE